MLYCRMLRNTGPAQAEQLSSFGNIRRQCEVQQARGGEDATVAGRVLQDWRPLTDLATAAAGAAVVGRRACTQRLVEQGLRGSDNP
jgi:hypothetical protein